MAGLIETNPIGLEAVLSSTYVIPGDEIILLPGTYTAEHKGLSGADYPGKGSFRVKLKGTAELPITIRPKTPGTVRINGGIELGGDAAYIILRDFEIAPTPTSREMLREDVDFPGCIYCTAPGCQIIGNYCHDGAEGISLFGSVGSIVKDNIVINIGWVEPDGGHGTGIYTHNAPGGEIIIQGNVFSALGVSGVNLWSAGSNAVQDYLCKENAIYTSGLLVSSFSGVCEDNTITDNHLYRGRMRLGYGRDGELTGALLVERNRTYHEYSGMSLYSQLAATVRNNAFVNYGIVPLVNYRQAADATNTVDNNAYYHTSGNPLYLSMMDDGNGGAIVPWATWNEMGFDVHSSVTTSLPATNEVFTYSTSKGALVVVWNWEGLDAVSVDLTDIASFGVGDVVNARNAQDYVNDIQQLTLDGDKKISVAMRAASHTVAPCVGYNPFNTTFPLFGAFVVELA